MAALAALAGLAGLAGCSAGAALHQAGAVDRVHNRPPASARRAAEFPVRERTVVVTDPSRPTLDYGTSPPTVLATSRTLAVEIRYPVGAGGPFPVIVFAHGYGVMPDNYGRLLDAWASAGFVVVAPVFPVTNAYELALQGGGTAPEDDTRYEPGDVAFVVRAAWALARRSGSWLHPLVDRRRLALAGQSDGASTVAALEYAAPFSTAFVSLPVRPLAVVILSGSEFDGSPVYAQPAGGAAPAVLAAEGDADGCNAPARAASLYSAVAGGTSRRWFLALAGAGHLAPFTGAEPWFPVVRQVTTDFFRLALEGTTSGVTPAILARAAGGAGVARLSTAARVTVAARVPAIGCRSPAPTPLPAG